MGVIDYLVLPKGAKKRRKRRGIGPGSGHGKTACHGNKGQQARGRTKAHKGFEGGQMPLIRRLPKRGFTNKFTKEFQVVNIGNLASFKEESVVNPSVLRGNGLIQNRKLPVKILGNGKIEKKLNISAHAFSKGAKEAIEKAGGKAVVLVNPVRPPTK